MPGVLLDAVTWENLRGMAGAKAGYLDGPESQWPAEAWQTFAGDGLVHITVLADEAGEAFDGEKGDAGPASVATAIANRVQDGKWCWLYSNQDQLGSYLSALAGKGVKPTDRSLWPKPACYLWLADPSGNIAAGRWNPPVDPVAVQDAFHGSYDSSTLYVDLAAQPNPPPQPGPGPAPPKPTQEVCQVQLPVLQQGVTSESVRSVQKLVGGIADDAIFGPVTRQAVVNFQRSHGLAEDGIVGLHTWGALLGAPQ